jgi:hypothetical protein
MPTDTEITKGLEVGYLSSALGTNALALAEVQRKRRRIISKLFQDAATAGTAITETVFCRVPGACRVVSVYVSAPIAVTAAAANIATFNLAKRTAGAASTAVATGSTVTAGTPGTLTAFAPAALTITAANAELAAGDALTFAVVKGASGVALTAATSYLEVTVELEDI